jgi:monoamine oxidase
MNPSLRGTFAAAFVVSVLFAVTPAHAQRIDAEDIIRRGPVAPYLQAQFEVRKELDSARGYQSLDEASRNRLFSAQDRLFAVLGDIRNFEDLTDSQRSELDALQPELLAALDEVRDKKVICTRERSTGSRIKETRCTTRGEMDRLRDATQRDLERRAQLQQSDPCPPGSCIIPKPGGL